MSIFHFWHEKKKKKSLSKSKTNWMNSDGEQTEDSDSSFPCIEEFEFIDGVKVELAFHANMPVDMVCIDSGSNRLVLLGNDGMTGYQQVHGPHAGHNPSRGCINH